MLNRPDIEGVVFTELDAAALRRERLIYIIAFGMWCFTSGLCAGWLLWGVR